MNKCLKRLATQVSPKKKSTLIIALTLIASTINASELDLRISDDAIHGNYSALSNSEKTQFGLGYFYKNDDSSINIINADLHAKGQTAIGNLPTTIGIGFQGNFFKQEEFKGSAVGIGGSLRINLPSVPGLSVETALHYAPSVLSFGDSDEFRRFRLQTNYRIIENADISIGYRYLNVGVEEANDNHTFESGAFLGMKLKL